MRKFIIPTFVVASLTALLSTTPVHAQATRTWVSGVGDDANPCSRTAPCKTFAGAISKTATKGEINVLDPGGFGGVTITKSITIASEYVEAGVLVSGTNGIIINGAGVVVTLRGLDIEGVGTGLNGINFLQGSSLHVQNCTIRGFNGTNASGISFTPGTEAQLFVTDTIVMNNGQFAAGNGIVVRPTGSGNVSAVFTRVNSNYNTTGFKADGSAHTGNIHLSICESSASGNTQNGFWVTNNGTGVTDAFVNNTLVSSNLQNGLRADGTGARIFYSQSLVTNNGVGVSFVAPAGSGQQRHQPEPGQLHEWCAVDHDYAGVSETAPSLSVSVQVFMAPVLSTGAICHAMPRCRVSRTSRLRVTWLAVVAGSGYGGASS